MPGRPATKPLPKRLAPDAAELAALIRPPPPIAPRMLVSTPLIPLLPNRFIRVCKNPPDLLSSSWLTFTSELFAFIWLAIAMASISSMESASLTALSYASAGLLEFSAALSAFLYALIYLRFFFLVSGSSPPGELLAVPTT